MDHVQIIPQFISKLEKISIKPQKLFQKFINQNTKNMMKKIYLITCLLKSIFIFEAKPKHQNPFKKKKKVFNNTSMLSINFQDIFPCKQKAYFDGKHIEFLHV